MNFCDPIFLLLSLPCLLAYRILRRFSFFSDTVSKHYLLIFGIIFYCIFDLRHALILLMIAVVNFFGGLAIAEETDPKSKKRLLILVITLSLLPLLFYKYTDFAIGTLADIARFIGADPGLLRPLGIALPIGISFFTFQALSYSIDVYNEKLKPTKDFALFLLFVSYFPHLVAGPIMRAEQLIPQVEHPKKVSFEDTLSGIYLCIYGFFVKLVIADRMAAFVDHTYNNPRALGEELILGTYGFTFQIYCDFMGYSLIALGMSRLIGVTLVLNFFTPYLASNPGDFWRRWHISLSTWLRDYLYIPLGGNRHGKGQAARNAMITMVLGGIWHGAAWTYVLWGAYHGLLLAIYGMFKEWRERIEANLFVRIVNTVIFFHFVIFGWMMFRAKGWFDFSDKVATIVQRTDLSRLGRSEVLQLALIGAGLLAFEIYQNRKKTIEVWHGWNPAVRVGFFAVLIAGIMIFKAPVQSPFIYFQF